MHGMVSLNEVEEYTKGCEQVTVLLAVYNHY